LRRGKEGGSTRGKGVDQHERKSLEQFKGGKKFEKGKKKCRVQQTPLSARQRTDETNGANRGRVRGRPELKTIPRNETRGGKGRGAVEEDLVLKRQHGGT